MKKRIPRKISLAQPLRSTIAHHNFLNALLATALIVIGIAYMANRDTNNGLHMPAAHESTLACIFDSCNLV